MTVLRHVETALAALAFTFCLGWPVAEIVLHAFR